MYTDFKNLNSNSKAWVYLSNRKFTKDELLEMDILLKNFIEQWTAHKQELKASYTVYADCAIILSVDQSLNDASGCSIDSSVREIRDLESKFKVELFNRNLVAYKQGDHFEIVSLAAFRNLINQNKIDDNTIVLNTLIDTKGDVESKFAIPLRASWHQQLL